MDKVPQLSDMYRVIKANMADSSKIPITPALHAYFGDVLPNAVGLNLFGTPSIIFNKVKALDEIYVIKNAYHTKHENERMFGEPLIYNNIVSMDSADPMYKKKRKSLSGAFFKNKIRAMMNIVKTTSLRVFKNLQDEAVDGVTVIDLNTLTTRL